MFQRTNNRKNRNPDNEIRNEQKAEDVFNGIGNEAVSLLSGVSGSESNEANNRGMLNDQRNILDKKIGENKLKEIIEPIIKNEYEIDDED